MKRFELILYEAVCAAIPETTVRSLSKNLGMSDGYWSSITAQGLSVSNTGLINLKEYIDVRIVLTAASGVQLIRLRAVQKVIVQEIIRRLAVTVESFDEVFVENIDCREHDSSFRNDTCNAMPFVLSRY